CSVTETALSYTHTLSYTTLFRSIEELETGGKKSVKEQSVEDKEAEAQKAKDDEIAQLRQQIKLAEVTQQADEVLKESGLALGKEDRKSTRLNCSHVSISYAVFCL